MKQLKTVLIATMLTLTANAGWKPLKRLNYYGPTAFTLKDNVRYMEIRKHTTSSFIEPGASNASVKQSTTLRVYTYTPDDKKIFENMKMKKHYSIKKGKQDSMHASSEWYYNGFILDNAGKKWQLENANEVIDMVKPIDTPAEISLVLWLAGGKADHGSNYSAKYRKSGKNYIVREHFTITDYAHKCGNYLYQYKISRWGNILQKRLISKKPTKDCGSE